MPYSFPMNLQYCIDCGADPLVRAGPCAPAPRLRNRVLDARGRPTRASARLKPVPPGQAGITLIEVVIAVTLLSMLSVGMLAAIRMGFDALHKTNTRLMANRRVAGAQRVLEQELGGFVPVKALCSPQSEAPLAPFVFFQGQPQSMRLVSTYSLDEAWRGRPRILELQVIPGDEGRGVRLIVNEIPYSGPMSAGQACLGIAADPVSGYPMPQFR